MLSPVHSLRFCFLWYGLPSGEKGHVKRVFTKTLAKLAIFLKKTHSCTSFNLLGSAHEKFGVWTGPWLITFKLVLDNHRRDNELQWNRQT